MGLFSGVLGSGCGGQHQSLYPTTHEDVQEILLQARENLSCVRVTGGSFPVSRLTPDDIVVDLTYMDRLVGLDIYQQTVTVESGMRMSKLLRVLETVSLSIDLFGKIPDLAVCDAIAVGMCGHLGSVCSSTSLGFLSSLHSVEVLQSSGKITHWTWERNQAEMRTLCCGLGMAAVVITVTFKCVPLQRYTEISYLCSIRDVLEHWSLQVKSSFSQQLIWFPFSELTVMTHINPTEKYQMSKQPFLNVVLEKLGDLTSRCLRRLSLFLSSQSLPPLLVSIIGRIQFFSLWSATRHRSDFVHSIPRLWNPVDCCRGTSWLLPVDRLPEVLSSISQWTSENPNCNLKRRAKDTKNIFNAFASHLSASSSYCSTAPGCSVAPLFVQTIKRPVNPNERKGSRKPFLEPSVEHSEICAVWYDWFVPECDPDPIALSDFESIFLLAGGVRAWSGDRLTSPLVLTHAFQKYPHWCRVKSRVDQNNFLQSAYIQGTVYSECGYSVEFGSTLSLCSSVIDNVE